MPALMTAASMALAVVSSLTVWVSAQESRATSPVSSPSGLVPAGVWGGAHIRLEVTSDGAVVEYDCAHGTISEPLRPDDAGHFEAAGTYRPEHAGPVGNAEAPRRPANHSGKIDGNSMTLAVVLTDSAESVGRFTLVQGSEGDLVKCR